MKGLNNKLVKILLVDDNVGDARLAIEALKDGKITNELFHVKDGVEAMEFLEKKGEFKGAWTPDLILLDLNMPRMDGRAVLKEKSKYPAFAHIPVIVLTTSESEVDVVRSYSLNANCYITKPVDFDKFIDVVKSIEHFWFNVAILPPASVNF